MKRRISTLASVALALAVALTTSPARAGGIEMPDHGTEALGRGGAFAAKADDPTAIHHNVGGLAQQRGTRLLLNANVSRSSLAFQREGSYAGDPNDPATPWAGQPYPRVENQGGFSATPFAAIVSDFGLKRAAFALGTFEPSTVGGRSYPLYVGGAPSPARYDSVGSTGSGIHFHTAAAGLRVTDDLDIGIAVHVVQAAGQRFRTVTFTSVGTSCQDPARENPGCDARGEATVNGWSGTGSVGALYRMGGGLSAGLHFRGPVTLVADGTAAISAPSSAGPTSVPTTRAAVTTALPWILRGGIRKTFDRTADIELDFTYEAWSTAMNPGPKVVIENVQPIGRQERTVNLNYADTFSLRGGGSYTTHAVGAPVTFRGGAYYDSSATAPRFTRLYSDTLEKVAVTAGIGVELGAFRIDAAYASVFDIPRTVQGGELKGSERADASAVNDGTFTGHTHILSIGATVAFDTLFGGARLPSFTPGEKMAHR
jgi:long-chain fatty acid transport protein